MLLKYTENQKLFESILPCRNGRVEYGLMMLDVSTLLGYKLKYLYDPKSYLWFRYVELPNAASPLHVLKSKPNDTELLIKVSAKTSDNYFAEAYAEELQLDYLVLTGFSQNFKVITYPHELLIEVQKAISLTREELMIERAKKRAR